eukprot:c15440_g1_i1.p1 GENE.c15440_g1_i1~~c15440_g1_i1.p1  ORF type:complete len:367 (-),score=92.53 c15440_g1_i1:29-1129(-)
MSKAEAISAADLDSREPQRADLTVEDTRFTFRKHYDQVVHVYKKLNDRMFIIKDVLTTETNLIMYEDIYDVYFSVYEGIFFNFLVTRLKNGLSYRILGTIVENFTIIMDVISFLLCVVLFVISPLTITNGYQGLCFVILLEVLLQIYLALKFQQAAKSLSNFSFTRIPLSILSAPSIVLFLISFSLLIVRGVKTTNPEETALERNDYMCVDTEALGNYISFDVCDDHDKVYIWIIFLFIYIANIISIFVYVKFIRPVFPTLMKSNFYLYVLNKLRQNKICLTIEHIKRSPASRRNYSPFWSTDISETVCSTTIFTDTVILKAFLDDVVEGIEKGTIKLKNFKIGRESVVLVEYVKDLLKLKDKLLA